jgi:hypothetical protein
VPRSADQRIADGKRRWRCVITIDGKDLGVKPRVREADVNVGRPRTLEPVPDAEPQLHAAGACIGDVIGRVAA